MYVHECLPKSIFKNRGALCKMNCHPWATVCTRHHTRPMGLTVPELLAQRLVHLLLPAVNKMAEIVGLFTKLSNLSLNYK